MPNNTTRRKVVHENASRPASFDFNIVDPLAVWINKRLDLEERMSKSNLRLILWFFGLALVYIFLQHRFDGMIRKLENAEIQLQEARASYILHKSKYLYASKQSELAKKLEEKGFEKNGQPPLKIAIDK
jgi:Bacteriodetes cell division protein (FtsL-like)